MGVNKTFQSFKPKMSSRSLFVRKYHTNTLGSRQTLQHKGKHKRYLTKSRHPPTRLASTLSAATPGLSRGPVKRSQASLVSDEAPKRVRLQSELFGPVILQIQARISESPSFGALVESYRQEHKGLKVVSRDGMVLTDQALSDFAKRNATSTLCANNLADDYVERSTTQAFESNTDDWLAVVSTSESNPDDQLGWDLQAFAVAKLGATSNTELPVVWELSLLCDAKLLDAGTLLVQSFVYAVKVYSTTNNTLQVAALDLPNAYDNMTGLGMFARLGFSSLSCLLTTVLAPIVQHNARHKRFGVVVDDTSLPMAVDLADLSTQTLLANVGVHTRQGLSTKSSVDTLLFTAFKLGNILGGEMHRKCINARKRAYDLARRFYMGPTTHDQVVLQRYLSKLVKSLAEQVSQKYTTMSIHNK